VYRFQEQQKDGFTPANPSTDKYKGGAMPASPKMEQDPRVERYRWNAKERRHQVTKYNPKLVKFTRSGRPLVGPTVKLDNQTMRLDDAIKLVRGRAAAKVNAMKVLEETPLGSKYVLSRKESLPVYGHLARAQLECARAEALLKSGKSEEAKKAFAAATRSYNDAAIKLNSARRQIENNVELAVGLLKAVKAAGEAAEIGLMVVGAGAVGKAASGAVKAAGGADWLATAAKVVSGAGVKTAYSAADQVRDRLTLESDKPVDWAKFGKEVGKKAIRNFAWNLVSGSLSTKLESALKASGASNAQKLAARVGQKVFVKLARTAEELTEKAVEGKLRLTPRQITAQAVKKNQQEVRKILKDAGLDVAKGTGKAIFQSLVKAWMEAR
jgi:hypothetical protein